jgi:hypothetical protein
MHWGRLKDFSRHLKLENFIQDLDAEIISVRIRVEKCQKKGKQTVIKASNA